MSTPHRISVSAHTLAGVPIFNTLAAAKREQIASLFQGWSYRQNEFIIRQKTEEQAVYFIVSGEVRVKYFSPRGRQISFRDLIAGDMFGELAALDGQLRSAEVVALEETFILSLSRERFVHVLRHHPEVALQVMEHLAHLVRALSDRVIDFSTLAVRNRIHAELLRLARQAGVQANRAEIIKLPTHDEIAARLSTHREAVVHEIKHLREAGLVQKNGHRHLTVVDVARLEQIVAKGIAEAD